MTDAPAQKPDGEEAAAKERAEHRRVVDIVLHLLSDNWAAVHPDEDVKDPISLLADEIRHSRPRLAVMDKRVQDDPEFLRLRDAYEYATERTFGYKIRFGHRAEAHKKLVEEAKRVLLGITAARAAGFPLGELEQRVLGVLEAEKKEI